MAVLYLCNVGNRDLHVDGQPLPAPQTRALGEAILRDYDTYAGRLRAPIVEACLDFILKEHPRVDLVGLFATNQPEDTRAEFRDRDTVHAAAVIARALKERYTTKKIPETLIVEIRDARPAHYGDMYDFYGQQLERLKRLNPPDLEVCYVSPIGGIPAANFALLLRTIDRYAQRCHPLYVAEDLSSPVPMDVTQRIQRGQLRELARAELARGEFGQVASRLDALRAPVPLAAAARYAERRLAFDFGAAWAVLEQQGIPHAAGAEWRELVKLRDDLQPLLSGRPAALIGELYHNAVLTYRAGRYVDFLGRLFRFEEATLRWLVERPPLALPTDEQNGRPQPAFITGVEANPALLAHMQRACGGDRWRQVNRHTLKALAQYLRDGGVGQDGQPLLDDAGRVAVGAFLASLARFESLSDLRNKSIIAHGFRGVSREEITAKLPDEAGGPGVPLEMARALQAIGLDPGPDPFARVQAFLNPRLRDLT